MYGWPTDEFMYMTLVLLDTAGLRTLLPASRAAMRDTHNLALCIG